MGRSLHRSSSLEQSRCHCWKTRLAPRKIQRASFLSLGTYASWHSPTHTALPCPSPYHSPKAAQEGLPLYSFTISARHPSRPFYYKISIYFSFFLDGRKMDSTYQHLSFREMLKTQHLFFPLQGEFKTSFSISEQEGEPQAVFSLPWDAV